jgi:hypothetical protein
MPTATQTQTPDLSGLFDLDIEIELDDTTVTDCCSSIACGCVLCHVHRWWQNEWHRGV